MRAYVSFIHFQPTTLFLSLSLSVSLATAVSSSSFFCITPFKYSFCENALFLVAPVFEEEEYFTSFMSLSRGFKRCACDAVKYFSWSHHIIYNETLKGNLHFVQSWADKSLL